MIGYYIFNGNNERTLLIPGILYVHLNLATQSKKIDINSGFALMPLESLADKEIKSVDLSDWCCFERISWNRIDRRRVNDEALELFWIARGRVELITDSSSVTRDYIDGILSVDYIGDKKEFWWLGSERPYGEAG